MQKFRHKKTGHVYHVIEHVSLQSKTKLEDMDTLVLYRDLIGGRAWVRPVKEFYDGRFERVDTDIV